MRGKWASRPNHLHRAVGLSFSGDDAPTITLSAEQADAEEFVRLARRLGVPVVERGELARALSTFSPGEEIPERLYHAVALLLNELANQQQN